MSIPCPKWDETDLEKHDIAYQLEAREDINEKCLQAFWNSGLKKPLPPLEDFLPCDTEPTEDTG